MTKYHAIKERVDGITFDSKKEANRYRQLCLMERAKAIQDLKVHQRFPLIPKSEYGREVVYISDFTYYEDGHLVVEDTKGFRTDVYKLKARLFAERYKFKIKET